MNDRDIEERFKPITPACYGCTFSCASPALLCDHPLTIRLSYDGFTRKTYRFPSFEQCVTNKGMCNFYEPSPTRGAEYSFMKEETAEASRLEKEKKALDDILDEADDISKEEFKKKLKDLLQPETIKDDDE